VPILPYAPPTRGFLAFFPSSHGTSCTGQYGRRSQIFFPPRFLSLRARFLFYRTGIQFNLLLFSPLDFYRASSFSWKAVELWIVGLFHSSSSLLFGAPQLPSASETTLFNLSLALKAALFFKYFFFFFLVSLTRSPLLLLADFNFFPDWPPVVFLRNATLFDEFSFGLSIPFTLRIGLAPSAPGLRIFPSDAPFSFPPLRTAGDPSRFFCGGVVSDSLSSLFIAGGLFGLMSCGGRGCSNRQDFLRVIASSVDFFPRSVFLNYSSRRCPEFPPCCPLPVSISPSFFQALTP